MSLILEGLSSDTIVAHFGRYNFGNKLFCFDIEQRIDQVDHFNQLRPCRKIADTENKMSHKSEIHEQHFQQGGEFLVPRIRSIYSWICFGSGTRR